MGYTHYWNELKISDYSDDLISVFNQAYQDFLRVGITIEGKHINLFSLFLEKDTRELEFEQHFHEWAAGASGEPILFSAETGWEFCKTARKSYDVAVVLTLHLASIALGKRYSSDGRVIISFPHLEEYIKDEIDCSGNYVYDVQKLEELFDVWLNKCITFSEEIDKVEENKHVYRICDLPDHELEYIAKQVATGVTSIYLNNGQIVDVSFRR